MYINYLQDRKSLGFSCIKDIRAANKIFSLTKFIKRTARSLVAYIVKKGAKLFIIIFSKEVLVAVLIFEKSISMNVNPDMTRLAAEVSQSCISKFNNLKSKKSFKSLEAPSAILYQKLNYAYIELNKQEMEKLVNSVLAKSPNCPYEEISVNKLLRNPKELGKRTVKIIGPILSNPRFWELLYQIRKNIELSRSIRRTDILLGLAQNEPDKGSYIVTEALQNKHIRRKVYSRLTLLEKNSRLNRVEKSWLNMAQTSDEDNFSIRLTESGLSKNHYKVSLDRQDIKKKTQNRRAEPFYLSQVMGDSHKYSKKQLEIKAVVHLPIDYGVSTEGKTPEEQGLLYYNCIENSLKDPAVITIEAGTMNKQEPTRNYINPKTNMIIAFEKNGDFYFITAYKVNDENTALALETGNIGLSPAERDAKYDEAKKLKEEKKQAKEELDLFRSRIPTDIIISKKELKEVQLLKKQKETDPNFQIPDKKKPLMEREEKYRQYEAEYFKNNPNRFDDEL